MTRDEIESKVSRIVRAQFGLPDVGLPQNTRLIDDLQSDDLDRLEIAMEVEDVFEITTTEDDEESWRTIGDIIGTVAKALEVTA